MVTLYKTECSIDQNGHPTHTLTIMATGEYDAMWTTMAIDTDIWQSKDIQADQKPVPKDASQNTWDREGERWGISRDDASKPLMYLKKLDNGSFWSLTYHFISQ